MRAFTCAAIAALSIGLPAIAHADPGLSPMMDPNEPVQCAKDKSGLEWRIQCDAGTKVCLYTPNVELDADGNRLDKPLERARECAVDLPFDRALKESQGFHMVPGRADAPYGWTRDERGRVFQINFDLKRRLYFGAAYSPQKILDNPLESTRTSIDFGLLVFETLHKGEHGTATRHRLRLVEGNVHMEPFDAQVTVAHYDVSHRFLDPLLRVTTFVGTPQRHDLHLNLGMWTEAGGLEIHHTPFGNAQLWKHGTAEVTFDLWQSQNLDSFVRLRTGLGLEGQHDDINGYRSAMTAASAFEADWVLDKNGFHNLKLEYAHDLPHYFASPVGEPPPSKTGFAQRLRASVQYEGILIAINDQPVTLKLAAAGEKRDDLPGVPDKWAFVADVGLRFNLWAPPRPKS